MWFFFTQNGFNEYVTAGIIGNMMTECGGQTLNLNPYMNTNSNYYGLCQWNIKYFPQVNNQAVEQQCIFLVETLYKQFKTYGKSYAENFSYIDFFNLTNEREAADAFAKCYERPGPGPYMKRQNNAEKAYKYFTSEFMWP